MHFTGILLEDKQGREFVMMCLSSKKPLGKTFQLRGWQRRRLIPFRPTEEESKEIMAKVRGALNSMGSKSPSTI